EWKGADNQRLSALVALYDGEDSRYLNLRGPAGTIRTLKYASLFSESPERADAAIGDLSGRVVFIGVSELHSATQADSYDTIFSGVNGINVTGAEIGATALADLAEGASPRRPSLAAMVDVILVDMMLGAAETSCSMLVLIV